MSATATLYERSGTIHLVDSQADGTCLLYIDRHLVHEVTSPQAFEGLRMPGRKVRAPEKTLAVVDHNVPTSPDRHLGIKNEESRIPGRGACQERRGFRRRIIIRRTTSARDRSHRRSGAGLHAAGHDDRLRRQPHFDARRFRRAGARHRHVRGRACPCDADADPEKGEEHAGCASTANCRRASPQRTSSLRSSAEIGTAGGTATSSSLPVRRSGRCRWKAA